MPGRNNLLPPAIAALAGRRIDAPDTKEPCFPLAEAAHVERKLIHRFRKDQVKRLFCSGACGADILALEAAEKLEIPATLVLPFPQAIFREISVIDRPGNWEERFDRLVVAARDRGDLIELGLEADDPQAFNLANEQIVRSASTVLHYRHLAFVVWEGKPRGRSDATSDFLERAMSKGFEKRTVLTVRKGC